MATIIEHIPTGKRLLLLGAGHAMYRSARPNQLLGDLFPSESGGSDSVLAACDEKGKIGWVQSSDARVVLVDGVAPAEALS